MTPMTVRELWQTLSHLREQDAPVLLRTPSGERLPYVIEGSGTPTPDLRILAASWDHLRECYVIHTTTAGEVSMDEHEKRGPVCLDELVTVEAVYDPRERWNGFLCPRMDRDAVETVMAALNKDAEDYDQRPPSHRWEGDLLIVTEYDGEREFPETLHPDDAGRYALGARAWVWTEDE